MIVVVIILTAVFYIGVSIGKKKVINAEIEAQKYDEIRALARIAQAVDRAKDALYHEEQEQKSSLSANTTSGIKQISDSIVKSDIKPKQEKLPQVALEQNLEEKEKKIEMPKKEIEEKTENKVFYTVKLGTFSSEENATKLANLVKELNYSPEIKYDGEFFHVIVGKFPNKDEAKKFGDELISKSPNIENYIIKEL
jgi:cell division septation protein DedD